LLPNFWPIFLINFFKKLKIAKNNENPPKNTFWYICIIFSIWKKIKPKKNLSAAAHHRLIFPLINLLPSPSQQKAAAHLSPQTPDPAFPSPSQTQPQAAPVSLSHSSSPAAHHIGLTRPSLSQNPGRSSPTKQPHFLTLHWPNHSHQLNTTAVRSPSLPHHC